MVERSNQQRAGIGTELLANVANSIDSCLDAFGASRNNGLHVFPLLQEEGTEDHHNVGELNEVNLQDEGPLVLGRISATPGNEDIDVNIAWLLEEEHQDIEAARSLLRLPIPHNAITVRHYRWSIKQLRDDLSKGVVLNMPDRENYARVLLRLATVISAPTQQAYEFCHLTHPLGYDCLCKALEDTATDFSHSLGNVECLDNLLENMKAGFSMMQQNGNGDNVYVIKYGEQYAECLSLLAARLRSG